MQNVQSCFPSNEVGGDSTLALAHYNEAAFSELFADYEFHLLLPLVSVAMQWCSR